MQNIGLEGFTIDLFSRHTVWKKQVHTIGYRHVSLMEKLTAVITIDHD